MKQYRVIFHVNDDEEAQVNEAFNNLRNLLDDLGAENVEAELLANGRAVRALCKDQESNALRIRNLGGQGVRFAACANSLQHLRIDPADLAAGVEIVPAGVSELVKKQMEGWAYIHP